MNHALTACLVSSLQSWLLVVLFSFLACCGMISKGISKGNDIWLCVSQRSQRTSHFPGPVCSFYHIRNQHPDCSNAAQTIGKDLDLKDSLKWSSTFICILIANVTKRSRACRFPSHLPMHGKKVFDVPVLRSYYSVEILHRQQPFLRPPSATVSRQWRMFRQTQMQNRKGN
jgi:hypothetical protein